MKPVVEGLGRVRRYAYRRGGRWRYEARWRELDGRVGRKAFTVRSLFNLFCAEKAVALSNGKSARTRLTDVELAEVEAMKVAAAGVGKTVAEIFWKGLPGASARATSGLRVGGLVEKFLEARGREGLSSEYLRNLGGALRRLAADLDEPVEHLNAELLVGWLDGLKVGPRTWNNYRAAVATLAKFGREQDLICEAALPPWRKIEGIKARPLREKEPAIFTPERMRQLLEAAGERLGRCLAISAFAGLRTEEVQRLRWEDFVLGSPEGGARAEARAEALFLRRQVVKGRMGKRSPRSVPLRENLRAWLAGCEFKSGPVSHYKSSAILAMAKSDLARRLGLKWEQNALRHSWISYHLAECGDIHATATLAGNSPKVIKDHYLKLVTPRQAAEWFSIRPQNVSSGVLALDFGAKLRAK